MATNPADPWQLDLPNTTTKRVHELARGFGFTSATVLWGLRLIGIPAKSPSSKVTLEHIEFDTFWEFMVAHVHKPAPWHTVQWETVADLPVRHSACICGVRIQANDPEGERWRMRREGR
jgi:hypothetical protein